MPWNPIAEPVKLECNSLYIYTVPLLSNAFHWALVHIDQDGVATSHQWAPTTLDQTALEAYVEQTLPHGPMSMVDKDHILAYFKISDYNPMNITQLRQVCASIFPTSYPTAQENRRANISCRTWITKVFGRLITDERAQVLEDLVKKRSSICSDTFASDFLFQRAYKTQLYTL